ncbi:MAG: hypothetical protein R3313_04285 [Candidatus Saccharimonadales bacterium]|nr:hypothetical protein [Candidatus Saccharimonadales bacterium]
MLMPAGEGDPAGVVVETTIPLSDRVSELMTGAEPHLPNLNQIGNPEDPSRVLVVSASDVGNGDVLDRIADGAEPVILADDDTGEMSVVGLVKAMREASNGQ